MAAQSELEVRVRGKDELSPTLQQLESKVIRWVGAVSAALAAVKITTAPIIAAASFERELANVGKTTGFLSADLKDLSKQLLDISTRTDTSALDLAKIASAAGQQGLGKFGVQGVVQFTDSVARMSSVLGITAEVAAEDIGKIINIFKTPLKDIEQAISVFNEVSNNSTAKGGELLDVVKRIGDAAGQLNLQESTALAATGIDFGANAEVVGTAFAKMFSSLREKSGEFMKLLGQDSETYFKNIADGDLNAFKSVLQAIRGLNTTDQQTAITKLFGGGRISSLVNKLVQDTTNSVLDKNLQFAIKGLSGTSALKEQERVLNTLVAQSQAAINSLFKLGTEASEATLKPLTQYVAQLNLALQSPALKSFLQSVANAFLDMVGQIADVIKYVASLNINWENFIRVIKIFLGLKVAQYLGGQLSASAKGFGESLAYITKGAEATTKATAAMGAATAASSAAQTAAAKADTSSMLSRVLGIEDLSRKRAALAKATAEQLAAEKAVNASTGALSAAKVVDSTATVRANRVDTVVAARDGAASAQRQVLAKAEADAQATLAANQKLYADRLIAAEKATTTQRLAIEEDYQLKKAEIRATGTRVGLTALNRDRADLLAAEEASYTRSLVQIEAYNARRLALAASVAAGEIDIAKSALLAKEAALAKATTLQGASSAGAAVGGAGVLAATAALQKNQDVLNTAKDSVGAATKQVYNLGTAFTVLGRLVAVAGRIIAGGLFWITIIYSIADALGLLDNLGKKFQDLTDAAGFTSKAARDAAVAHKLETEALEDKRKKLEELATAYEDYINASTGALDPKNFQSILVQLQTSEDPQRVEKALTDLQNLQELLIEKNRETQDALSGANAKSVDEQRAKLAQYAAEVARLQKDLQTPTFDYSADSAAGFGGPTGASSIGPNVAEINAKIEELNKKSKEASASIDGLGISLQNAAERAPGITKSLTEVQIATAGLFTPETLAAANEFLVPALQIQADLNEALKDKAALTTAVVAGDADAIQKSKDLTVEISNLKKEQADANATLNTFVDNVLKNAKNLAVPDYVINSWNFLKRAIGFADPVKAIETVKTAAVVQAIDPTKLTGKTAPKATKTPSTGTGTYSKTKNKDGEERRQRQAALDLERAQIQAVNNLKGERNKQELALDDILYSRGLQGLKDYYENRERIQLQGIQFDIDDKKLEVKAVEKELALAKEQAEKDKFTTQKVKLNGQIAVLEEQKKAVTKDNAEESRKASESFFTDLRSQTNKLAAEGIIPQSAFDLFSGNLQELLDQYRVTIAKMRGEGQDVIADALIGSANAASVKAALQPIANDIQETLSTISRYRTRLDLGVTNGILTSNEAQAAYNKTVKAQIPALQDLLKQQEATLAFSSAPHGSRAFLELAAQVDQTRLSLEQLNAEQDKTAKDFNKQTTDSLGQILGTLEISKQGFADALNNFLLGILKSLQSALGQSIAEMITKGLGQSGAGGLGGWLQGVLQGGAGGVPKDAISGAAGAAGITLGTIANPMYVTAADPAGLIGDVGDLTGGTGVQPGEDLTTKIDSTVGELGTQLSSLFSDLGSGLSGLLNSIGDIFSGGGGGGGFASFLSSLFHNGGIAGTNSGMSRKVHPGLFSNAPRYHSGGIAGLAPDEVPAILKKGEEVLTQNDARHRDNAGGDGGGAGTRIVNVLDPELARGFMESSQGERVILNHIKANAGAISQLVKSGG